MGRTRQYASERLSEKWREGTGMPNQRFSIGESCALLDIDRVTLMRWMAVEAIHPLTDPRDKRYKYLTREQLLTLARAHDRAIRDESTIGPRLTGLQRETLARIQALEESVAEMRRALALDTRRYAAPERPQPALTAPPAQLYTPSAESRPSASPTLRPGEWRTLPPIPEGWVTPHDLARELGVALRTFHHAMRPRFEGDRERYGSIPYHAGRWRHPHPGNFASDLLDPEQQEMARQVFSGRQSSAQDAPESDVKG